jgi:hypothetical protein
VCVLVRLSLDYAPAVVIERIQIRRGRRPKLLRPELTGGFASLRVRVGFGSTFFVTDSILKIPFELDRAR